MEPISEIAGTSGTSFLTRSGRWFDPVNPAPAGFVFADIAGGLSKLCRYGGQTPRFYSVAEHCYRAAVWAQNDGLPAAAVRAVLMHDAAEAFVGDLIRPIKRAVTGYAELEAGVAAVIGRKYGIAGDKWPRIAASYDLEILIAERRAFWPADTTVCAGTAGVPARAYVPDYLPPEVAEAVFTEFAREVGIDVTV